MSKRAKLLIISITVAVLGVLAFTGVALAADPTPPANPPRVDVPPGWGACGGGGFGPVWSDAVTKLLGLTAEQIQAQRREGKSLAQIAAAKGVTENALVAAILAERKELIQKRVTAGLLTQAQADQMLKVMEQNIRESVKRTTIGPPDNRGAYGFGQPGMMGGRGMMGRWGGQVPQGTANQAFPGGRGMMR